MSWNASGLLKLVALLGLATAGLGEVSPSRADRDDPRVRLIEPERGERRFTAPATILLEARAEATRGRTIAKVEFFADGQPIGEVTAAPYEIVWTNVPEGRFRLRARATDDRDATDWLSAVVVVRMHENREPRVRLVSPHAQARFTAPATIELEARARDRNHNLSRVEFYANGVLLGSDTRRPFRFTWTSVSAGDYVLTAKAIDALGATDISRAVPIEVTGNLAPTVNLTSPANNAEFSAPATVTLNAEASDPDGTVSRVDFFANGAPVGGSTEPPFSVTVNNLAQGTYTLTAIATDNLGAEAASSPVLITVVTAAQPAQLYFIHTDHLNTPRLITNQLGQAVWSWNNDDPFGNNVPNENPSGLGNFTCNLRLPGQYFDKETNTHYNYFRDYDPGIGRYLQSDPIGLRGGINTYAYANNNPLSFVDPLGLDVRVSFFENMAFGFGHVGIGIVTAEGEQGTVGFYPQPGAPGDPFAGVPGAVLADPPNPSQTMVIPTTPQQDQCVTNCINERTANPGIYNVIARNCKDLVFDYLTGCGIRARNVRAPAGFFNYLRQLQRRCSKSECE